MWLSGGKGSSVSCRLRPSGRCKPGSSCRVSFVSFERKSHEPRLDSAHSGPEESREYAKVLKAPVEW